MRRIIHGDATEEAWRKAARVGTVLTSARTSVIIVGGFFVYDVVAWRLWGDSPYMVAALAFVAAFAILIRLGSGRWPLT